MLLQLDGSLHLAPLKTDFAGRVLELGAGTGIWSMDMGDKYPSATIMGVDLSPTQTDWVPPNVYFEVDDIEEPWTYSSPFDFIHGKWLAGSIRDWPKLMRQSYDNLNEGGWVEFSDWDYRPRLPDGAVDRRDNWITKWHKIMMGTCEEKTGASASPGPLLKNLIRTAGFEEVKEKIFKVPVGTWPKDKKLKEVGQFYRVALEEGLDAISLRILTHFLRYSLDEATILNAKFRAEIKEVNFYHL
jgi:SAM-dependent methyltransferase